MGACVLDPLRRIYLFFVIPMPAIVFAGATVIGVLRFVFRVLR